jgi:hypothetical protein
MNYLNLTEVRQHIGSLTRSVAQESKELYFGSIIFDAFDIKLYAGRRAYCQPNKLLDNLLDYTHLQIMIDEVLNNSPGKPNAIKPFGDERFSKFEWAKYFTYLNHKGVIKPSYMGAHVPLADACCLVRDFYKLSRLKIFY